MWKGINTFEYRIEKDDTMVWKGLNKVMTQYIVESRSTSEIKLPKKKEV